MALQFENIGQMLAAAYGTNAVAQVAKADAPVLSGTTGVFNPVFGAMAFSQLNNEGNAFALMPKYPWPRSGFRVITADAGSTAGGNLDNSSGIAAIPATIKPTFAEITVTPAQVAHNADVEYIHELRVRNGDDDAVGDIEFLRTYLANLHSKRINEMLLADVDTALPTGAFESIDRVTASSVAATAGLFTAGDEDIYGIDRSSATWADAVVNHNSTTDRTLTLSLIEDTLASLADNGARTNLILTGNDTKWRIISLAQTQVRYQGVVQQGQSAKVGINGVETEEGVGFGVRVATVYGIPMFASQAVQKDTISRIYCLDTTMQEDTGIPRLGIAMLSPTLYFESGMSAANPNPFAINKFGTEGLYYTSGQLVCTFPAAQGSIRDLK